MEATVFEGKRPPVREDGEEGMEETVFGGRKMPARPRSDAGPVEGKRAY